MMHRPKDRWFYFNFRKGGGLRRQGDLISPNMSKASSPSIPMMADICVYAVEAASGAPGESHLVAASTH
jgi:hypothetical protein